MRQVVLLGPQRFQPTLRSVVDALGIEGRIAAVTAGWQEREGEDAELSDHLGGRVVNLRLHARGEEVFAAEPALFARLRRRQERLKKLQAVYRLRLDHQLAAVWRLYERNGEGDVIEPEREDAIAAVRALDEHHLERVRAVHRDGDAPWPAPAEGRGRYPELERHRAELAEVLAGCAALAIAGGHVAVLLNRLRLFRVLEQAPELPVFAWSAGAMALAERVALFHDHPPQGAGNAEVLDAGLGVLTAELAGAALLPLPHAGRRLRLGDRERVGVLARRFAPLVPVTLDAGARLVLGGGEVGDAEGSRRLLAGGGRGPVTADGAAQAPPEKEAEKEEEGDELGEPAEREEGEPESAAGSPAPGGDGVGRAIHRLTGREAPSAEEVGAFLAEHEVPIREGTTTTFIWRGEADRVLLRHWIFGLPSSHRLKRIAGTDLWWATLEVPERSRIEYKFEVVDNGHRRLRRDPFNPHTARDPFGVNSVLHGVGYQTPQWTRRDPRARPGGLEELTIPSDALGGERRALVYLPARLRRSRRYPLLVVHDGADYLRYAEFGTVLDNLIDRLEVAPLVAVLTQSPDRLREYAADRRHARFVAEELVPRVAEAFPIEDDPAHRGLMGASFGAVAALHAAWSYPGRFGRLLLQSGSFAFSDIGRHRRSRAFDPVAKFVNAFRDAPGRPAERLYVTCGRYESLIYENRSLVPLLQEAGMEVRYREARDGHNWQNWRDRLRGGLSWLFPGPLWMVYE